MNLLRKTEKLIKQNWKERKRITLAVIVSFLINGGVGYATEELSSEIKVEEPKVDIKPKDGTQTTVKTDSTGTIVDIAKPENGISHNIYDTFNMKGNNAKVLFNNSSKKQESVEDPLGFKNVDGNKNFSSGDKATLIITEITGGDSTTLEGSLEVRRDNNESKPYGVDLIFANENGIRVNGITYYNIDNVMYVNDYNWATRDKLEEQKKELERKRFDKTDKDKDITLPFGNKKKSEGVIHTGEKVQNDFTSDEKSGWEIQGEGISRNEGKKKRLEEEKKRLEEERERLERERLERERLERERLERERLERERLERERLERERLERERLERERLERERLERERLERERLERERLEREREREGKEKEEQLEREHQERERQEQLEREKQEKERKEQEEKQKQEEEKRRQEELEKQRQEDEKKIKELEEKIENIEKKLKEAKEKIEVEEVSNGENNPKNDIPTPMALLSPETPTAVSYISTSALGSMHGNQILMRADDSGFYGVQYSGEQKKNAISIDKQTGEIDVKDVSSSSSLTPRSVKLRNTSGSGFEEIPEEEIEGNTTATPVLHKSSQKVKEDGYNLEEEEVAEEDVSEADVNKVNKNITMDGYQANGLIPRTFRTASSGTTEYEEIPKEVLEEAERGEEATSVTTLPANSTSLLTEALPVAVKQEAEAPKVLAQTASTAENPKSVSITGSIPISVSAATKAPVTSTPVSETTPAAVQAVPVSAPVGITAAPKTISEETLQEAVEVKKPKAEVLKRLNHIEVKDPSKTQLEKVDGHDKSTLIQIATANDNGISHNEYDQFSIEQDENVLLNNNSGDSEAASKLLSGKTFAGNKNLKGRSATLIINEVGLNNNGATKLAGGLEVLGKKSDVIIANENGVIVNGGRFENVGDLTLSTGKYKEGRTKKDFQFEERKGKIDVVGKSDIQNSLNIYSKDFDVNADLSAQNLNVDASGQVSVKNATVSVEDVVDINTKTLKNSNAKIRSKNAVKIKGEDIFNEENSKISADVLLIDGKKVENSGEIEASDKLGIHATEDIINKRVIAGKILDLKAGKSFKNIDSALLYAQEQLQVDANEISNIGSSILSNGSLFLRGENAITNENGGVIQSKGEGRLIGRKITNNASSISSLAKLYLKTDELLNIGKFSSALKVTNQMRQLYKHIDVRESSWKSWYNGYNITISIPRAKKELKVKQASIDAGDDLVISKYKNDKTKVYNRDSAITSRGNIYVEGSVDNLTTTSASKLENMLKRTKVKLAWNTSSLVDRSQFSSGVDVDGASLFDLLKEKDKLKRYQYFNLLKGLNDPELDRILNQVLGADWKAKDDIPDLKLGGNIEYYSADNRAKIDSIKNIFVEGDIENSSILENVSIDQWKKEKPKIDQEARKIEDALFNTKVMLIGDSTITEENIVIDGVQSRKVSVLTLLREKDPKKRKEFFEKLKTINDPKLEKVLASTLGKDWKSKQEVPVIKEGYVGKKKKENTIYQMILEDGDERPIDDLYQLNNNDVKLRNVLQKQNGKYEKLKDNKEFLFKTSDVIKDKVEYKGYDYLVKELKSKGKNIPNAKLIGDSQYQYDMISNLWKSYDQKAPGKEYIEGRFKNSLEEAERLNLEIGKPLTEQQQKELSRNIIWYVEKEIEGEKVLTPVMYFPEDKLHTLSRIREDKAISTISAWGSIFAESDNVTNENSTINAVKNVKLKTNVLVNRGSKEFDSDIYAGEELDIETKKVLSEFANLKAMGNIDVTARNIDVKASDIVSKSNVNLRAENIDIKDEVLKSSTKDINSKTVGKASHFMEETTTSKETSRASNIQGKNVYVKADENLNVKGSKIRAEETADLDAAKISIEASKTEKKESSHTQGSGINSKGLLEYLTEETTTTKTEEANGSSVEAGKNLYVKAKEDLHVKGSDLKSRNAKLSGRKVTIENEEEKSSEDSSKFSSQVFGVSDENKSKKATKARASNVEATGTLVIEAEEEAKIKGSNLKAGQGYVDAKKTKFEAAKETYEEKVSKTSLGFTVSGSAGILGVGVEGEADGAERTAGGSVVNEYKNKKLSQGTNGGRKSSALAEGDIGLKLAHQKSEKEEQKWKNSTFKTTDGDLNVTAKGENDIGGLDISSKGETNIVGKKVLTTKQKNTTKERSYGFELSVKQSGGTTSSVVDALTTAKEIADDSKNGQLNKGLAAAKTIGAATGLLFNDLAGVQSKQSLNFSFNHSKSEMEEDTKNKIHSEGKLNIRSTEEDIELKNTEIKSKEKVTLDSERDIKVSGGKRTEKTEGYQLRATAHLQESAGFGAVSGGNTTVGVGGSANFETEKTNNTTNENSRVESKDLQIRSKRHTDIKGANVRAEEKAVVKVGGNLTVKSETDQYKEQKVKANAGVGGSVGVSSNTIVTALGSVSAGGGYIWKEGEKITERTGLTAGKSMDIEVGGDLNVDSATVGSDMKKGKLDVKGDINTKDRTTQEKSGGAVVGASVGLTGEIGVDLEIGDKKNREVKSNSVLSFQKENISAKKVTQNGEKSNIESLKTDMIEETEVVRDEFEKGGSANLSFSVNDTKKIAGAVKGAVKSAVQKVRSHTSSSENLSSSGRASRTEEISTLTRRQEDSREDIYSKLSGEGTYSLVGKPGSQEGTYENVGAGKRGEAPEKPARKAKEIEAENPYSTIGDNESTQKDRKALAKRPLPEIPEVKRSNGDSDGIYETIPAKNKNSDPTYSTVGAEGIYSLAGRAKTSDENSPYATVNKERKRNNEDIYSKASGEGIYSLAGKPGSQEGTYENVGAGKRGEAPEKPARKAKEIEAENPYSTIRDSESIPKDRKALANRPLPEIPGVRKSSESSDGIYETIKTKPTEDKLIPRSQRAFSGDYESIPELKATAKTSQKVEDLYAKIDPKTKTPKVVPQEEIAKQRAEELTKQYGPKVTVTDETGTYSQVKRVGKPSTQEPEALTVKPKSTEEFTLRSKKSLSDDYERIPETNLDKNITRGNHSDYEEIDQLRPKVSGETESPYATISEEITKRAKIQSRELPKTPEGDSVDGRIRKVTSDYEDVDTLLRRPSNNAESEDPYSTIPELKATARTSPAQEDLYAKINPKTKTPKVVSQEEIAKQKAQELTKQYGPKVTVTDETGIYSQVKRVGKPSTQEPEALTVKPKLAEEGLTPRSQRTVAADYEKLPDFDDQKANSIKRENPYELDGENTPVPPPPIRKVGEREVEAVIKSRTVNGEDTYEPVVWRKYSDSKFDEISLSDPPSLKERLQQEAGQKLTFTETSVSNTDYVPKKLSKKEIEALSEKARKAAESKDPHEATMEKIKKIAEDPNNIPKEHLLSKLEEYTYGYKNDDVIRLANRSAEDGTKLIVPDMVDKSKITKQDQKNLGEIMEKLPFSDDYNQFRRQVDEKIYDKLSNNPEFKDLMNKPLSGNEANIQKLFDIVVQAKKDSFKELAGVDIETPKLVLNKDKNQKVHGEYLDDTVTMGAVPPIKSKKQEDHNKELLNTIIHELTHHDQAYLAGNKDNPNLKRNLQEEARVFGVNQDLYVPIDSHKHGYKEQPLERDAFRAGDALSDRLMKKVYQGSEESDLKGIGNTDYVPKKLTKQEQEQLFKESRQKAKERDGAKEAEKKLKLLADNADSIPKEHMLKALKELAYGLSMEDVIALREKAKDTNKKVHRPDTLEGFEGQNVGNMGKVLRKIQFDPEYIKTREEINQRIVEKLDNSREFHDLMKGKLSGNEEGIKKLFTLVEQAKHDSLQEITGIDGKRVDLNIYKSSPLAMKQGHYKDDVVNMGDVPLFSFLRSKKQNNKEILNTIIHELTHHDQAQIRDNRHKDIPEHMKNDSDLLILNETYYISPTSGHFKSYKEQPMEREAFLSGDKLGQQLSKLVDKGYGGRSKEIEEIVHLPSKNKNLEADREAGAAFGDSALIYGLKDGRKELLIKANKADKEKKNPIIADSYIGELNLGFEFSRLSELANKVNSGKVSEQEIDRIVNYRDPNMDSAVSDSLNRINKANVEDNKRVLTELLQNETVIDSLKRMDNLNQREKVLTESLKKNESLDLDEPTESPNYTTKQNEEIREYNQIKKDLNEARMDFFAEKTKLIAKKVLDEGGQLYFSLDGLATDSMRFNKDRTVIDMNRLKEVFNPESEHYNAVTSKELRYLYENYKDNPNLKFMIKDQIIENPLKTLEIPKQKQAPATEDSSDGRERRILPKLFKKSKTEKGPVIKHLGGDDTKDSFYFPLDKIVTKNGNISKNMTVNMDNIKKAFNPKDKHYNSPEAKSLRAMYEQDHTMASTKFIVGNQVIANPFTNPELQQYIQEHKKEVEKKATGLKKKPELPEKPRKIKAKPITEDSRQKAVIFYTPEEMTTRSDKIVSQTSQSPSTEPVYADIQFKNRRKEGKVLRNSEETIYEEVKGKSLSTPSREKAVIFYTPEEMTTRSDKIVSQTSQSPSTEPVYADIQFKNRRKAGKVLRNSEETIYEEVGRKVEEPIYENVPRRKK
ncbi:MAG: hemagglutinin repeat-containing protein [Fusobacterium necrophorum]|nr:hemagglutinin repeat-containing protein [Fusobacterium necrophorum]